MQEVLLEIRRCSHQEAGNCLDSNSSSFAAMPGSISVSFQSSCSSQKRAQYSHTAIALRTTVAISTCTARRS